MRSEVDGKVRVAGGTALLAGVAVELKPRTVKVHECCVSLQVIVECAARVKFNVI